MASAADSLSRKPQNLAVKTNPAHELKIVEVETPTPGPDDCLVHVRATGICGSDVHFWKSGSIGESLIEQDQGLGHESSGIVVKTGDNVTNLKVGQYNSGSCVS